ncbi:MAG TPA: hypothetical protein VGF71_04600 [Caulobacteraceae bacterium]
MLPVDRSTNSQLGELIVEHQFIAESLRRCWSLDVTDVEVLRSEIDTFGYDLVMARGAIVRHIQLKSSVLGGKTDQIKIGLRLSEKPSGGVNWIIVTKDLQFDHFLWLGGSPGEALRDIRGWKVAKHTKANAQGTKTSRAGHRLARRAQFERIDTIHEVLVRLLGPLQ